MGIETLAILIEREDKIYISLIDKRDTELSSGGYFFSGRNIKENEAIIKDNFKNKFRINGIIQYNEDLLSFKRLDDFSSNFPGGYRDMKIYEKMDFEDPEKTLNMGQLEYPILFKEFITHAFYDYFTKLQK